VTASRPPRPFAQYLAWQAPGWVIAAVALFWICLVFDLATWLAVVALALYIGKDLALYPAMRQVFRAPPPARPIGHRAAAVEHLAPCGYVRVNGELWKARALGGDTAPGDEVVVRDAEGLTLIVEKP
jgi:membrane protein implicated in regulation of membrane protease activity